MVNYRCVLAFSKSLHQFGQPVDFMLCSLESFRLSLHKTSIDGYKIHTLYQFIDILNGIEFCLPVENHWMCIVVYGADFYNYV